ncbi:MAG: DUF1588 domain-containing protein [Myxococcota bacterium]
MSRLAIPLILFCAGCSGNIADGTGEPPGPLVDREDGGAEDGAPAAELGALPQCEQAPVIRYLETQCGNAACHGGGAYPTLNRTSFADLPTLRSQRVDEPLIVPGDPDGSWLYRKIAGTQGAAGGALMPLGASSPREDIAVLGEWIRAGADTECDIELPPPPGDVDPNTLAQSELFSCSEAEPASATAPRLRRILGSELLRAGSQYGDTAALQSDKFYSTHTDALSVDEATLNLLFLSSDALTAPWTQRGGAQLVGLHDDERFSCIFDSPSSAECRTRYVETLLRRRALFRTPSSEETALIRTLLDDALDAPDSSVEESLRQVVTAAMLLPGGLFRSELGEGGALSADELALAFASLLSDHPVGVPFDETQVRESHPDFSTRFEGRYAAIRQAASDGTIADAEVRRVLFRRYAFGIDDERPDLLRQVRRGGDFSSSVRRAETRGSYWIAPNLMRFFREWLDYEAIEFKQTPGATSNRDDFTANRSFGTFIQDDLSGTSARQRGYQPRYDEALDDVVARTVIESHQAGTDVFRALMTTTLFSVPSNEDLSEGRDFSGYGAAYGLAIDEAVANTREARWRTFARDERIGVLTHPAWLASHGDAFEDGPSIVHRGKWIRERLFSQTVPSLAFVMVNAQLAESDPNVSARERVFRATGAEGRDACAGCHALMNSLGHPFESFNHAGFARDFDRGEGGRRSVDSSAVITNLPDPSMNRTYRNTREFIEALSESAYERRGFIRHAFRYFAGRNETLEDACTLAAMENALDEDGSFFSMVEAFISSPTFSHRRSRP